MLLTKLYNFESSLETSLNNEHNKDITLLGFFLRTQKDKKPRFKSGALTISEKTMVAILKKDKKQHMTDKN